MKLLKISLIFLLCFSAKEAFAADRYWVGGGSSTNWNATANTNWAATSGGAGNQSVPTTGDRVFIDNNCGGGTVNVNVNTASLGAFDMTNSACTLSGASSINVVGVTASTQVAKFAGTITWTGALTLNPTTGTANINFTSGTLTPGGNMTIGGNASATVTLQDNLTFGSSKILTLTLSGAAFDMNGKTISGNSSVNRILITSGTIGTQKQITRSSGAFANADFRDIDLEAAYNCSAITGLCGDAGGNSADFTFTAASTQTWSGTSGGNWSANAWTSRVPLPQDDVVVNTAFSSGQTVTFDMPRLGHTVDISGATWSGTALRVLSTGGSLVATVYGSFKLPSGLGTVINGNMSFEGRSGTLANGTSSSMPAGGWQIMSSGNSFSGSMTFQAFGGTYQLQDAFTTSAGITLNNGTLDLNSFNVTSTLLSSGGNVTRGITFGGSNTWTVTGTGSIWNINTSSMTFTPSSGTVEVTNTTATGKTFTGGNQTYNIVTFTGSNITVSGSNTFDTLNLNNPGLIGTKFTQSTNNTATNWNISGSVGSLVSASSTSATNATWTKAGGGTVCASYISITDITASPVSTFYAANSTDGGDNTNWTFTACPGGSTAVPDIKRKMLGI